MTDPSLSRPLIGITIGGSDGLSQPAKYGRAIERAGGVPILVPPPGTAAPSAIWTAGDLDGLLLPGGPADVDPARYGADRHPRTQISRELDRLEFAAASWAIRANLPTLGICRGQQLINVVCGGSLVQHLPGHRKPFWRRGFNHPLLVQPESRLARIFGTTRTRVNSYHHQAVDRLGAGLEAVGWAPDGTIEALESRYHPWLVAVQFHPEDLIDAHLPSQRLFAAFVAACRQCRPTDGEASARRAADDAGVTVASRSWGA
jgi:gamma-glutamyl-gamma-aminobutyrate hydrolase PuuD